MDVRCLKFPINARNADSITLQRKIHDRYAVGEKKMNEWKQCPVSLIYGHTSLLDISEDLGESYVMNTFLSLSAVYTSPVRKSLTLPGGSPALREYSSSFAWP